MGGIVKSLFGGGGGPKGKDYRRLADANVRAAEIQAEAVEKSIELQEKIYEQTREDYRPWRETGERALMRIEEGITAGDYDQEEFSYTGADLESSPGYQFRLAEGEKAIKRAAAAGSGVHSGATLAALSDYGQNTAAAEYDQGYNRALSTYQTNRQGNIDNFNRNALLSGTGQQATGAVAGAGQNYANQAGAATMQGGEAMAAGQIGYANAIIQGKQAKQQASQSNFNNLLSIGGAVAGFM